MATLLRVHDNDVMMPAQLK